jgi:hypothetical protein
VKTDAERRAHMEAHFSQAMTVHEAVIRGDLQAATQPAVWLANHDAPSFPARGIRAVRGPSEKRIHELASQASRAEDSGARTVFYGQISTPRSR